MFLNYYKNQWESAFFGRPIGCVEFSEKNSQNVPHFELLQAKVDSDEFTKIDLLQQKGFHFVESEVDFCLNLSVIETQSQWNDCLLADVSQIDELEELVQESFVVTRFREPYFTSLEKQKFYAKWIRNAVLSQFDDVCLIIKHETEILGCISLRLIENVARVGLLAVKTSIRRKGVATILLRQAIAWAKQQRAQKLFIATQLSNISAINLYCKFGAKIENTSHWFYKLEDNDDTF